MVAFRSKMIRATRFDAVDDGEAFVFRDYLVSFTVEHFPRPESDWFSSLGINLKKGAANLVVRRVTVQGIFEPWHR